MVIVFDGEHGRGEQEYLRWVSSHQDGLIIQSGRKLSAFYLVLHRTTCRSVTVADRADGQKPFTSGRYIKTCSTSGDEITKHLQSLGFYELSKLCSLCKPPTLNWSKGSSRYTADANLPTNDETENEKKRRWIQIAARRGAVKFRNTLIKAYGGRCAASGCNAVSALEAAHIVPYRQSALNRTSNGLLLRADIHTLFDLGLVSLSADRKWVVSRELSATDYQHMHGKKLLECARVEDMADMKALNWHRQNIFRNTPALKSY